MISHSPGATGTQESPPGRQLDHCRVAIRLEIDEAAGSESAHAYQTREGRFRRGPRIGRVQEHDVEPAAGRRHPGKRVGTDDFDIVGAEGAHGAAERRREAPVALDHDHGRGTTRRRLEPERTGPGEEIEAARPIDVVAKPVEHGLADSVRRRAKPTGRRHREQSAPPPTGNDAHGVSRCTVLHVCGDGAGSSRGPTPILRGRATIVGPPLTHPWASIPLREFLAAVVRSGGIASAIVRDGSAEDF